jgi:glucose uptake protein GlcU
MKTKDWIGFFFILLGIIGIVSIFDFADMTKVVIGSISLILIIAGIYLKPQIKWF